MCYSSHQVQDLLDLLVRHNEDIPLDVAALELAKIEFPDLEVEPWIDLLDSYANELGERISEEDDGMSYIQKTNHYLFDELGFRGNDGDFYSPLNSCLNQVLMERTGLPITISLVYMEIGRRLARPVYGIGMPGHFLVEYDDGDLQRYIDPFHHGRMLDAGECLALASRVTGMDLSENMQALEPVSKRQMALRMLNNLRAAYLKSSGWVKALEVQDLLVQASPGDATEYRQRGYLHLQMRHFQQAERDLEKYLALSPEARDKAEIEKRLKALRRWAAGLN
ncbi:MAG TPA: transglutaminase-like domain-containing protein [Bryobacteraceae bacterium]|nr:transglutaminase-like domain-containing protein [Bryobacteraceae bacterium]